LYQRQALFAPRRHPASPAGEVNWVYGNRGIYPVLPKPPYPADPATMDRDELRA